jgi:hypothetical protein
MAVVEEFFVIALGMRFLSRNVHLFMTEVRIRLGQSVKKFGVMGVGGLKLGTVRL